jgi:hypothetical protein
MRSASAGRCGSHSQVALLAAERLARARGNRGSFHTACLSSGIRFEALNSCRSRLRHAMGRRRPDRVGCTRGDYCGDCIDRGCSAGTSPSSRLSLTTRRCWNLRMDTDCCIHAARPADPAGDRNVLSLGVSTACWSILPHRARRLCARAISDEDCLVRYPRELSINSMILFFRRF